MWGFQRHFWSSVKHLAEDLFERLDPSLKVETFLLGLIREGEVDENPVCLEPQDCGSGVKDFMSVREDSNHFLAVDGQANLIATAESHMRNIQRRRRSRANELAVLKSLDSQRENSDGERYFFSGFLPVGKYDVGIILVVSQFENASIYQLPKVHAEERYAVPGSLIEAAAGAFLGKCISALYVPDAELVDWVGGLRPEEITRIAGDRLMEAPVFAAREFEGLYGLFTACNYIASMNYEGAGSEGGLIIARKDHPNIAFSLRLAKPVRLAEHRAMRKLLEVSATGDSLLSNGAYLLGFGKEIGTYNQSNADLFHVRFVERHKWELLHAGHAMMRVNYGVPRIPVAPLREGAFLSTIQVLFGDGMPANGKRLYELACEACRQRHGTLLIMTPAAKAETARLAGQATVIESIPMTAEILRSVTAIDGAVMLDLEGVCHAFGVILDGIAIPEGNPARGARFNSSLRYVSALNAIDIPCLAVVVSEDGTAELIPNLPPRIGRSELKEKEAAMDSLLALEKWSLDASFPVINWLDKHRFYLSTEMCDKANEVLGKHDAALQQCRQMRVIRSKFTSFPEMSDAYLV